MACGWGAGEAAGDEGAQPGPAGDQAFLLQLPVSLEDGVGVDGQLGDDLLGGGQLVTGLQQPVGFRNLGRVR